ncbi:MAG: chemotaxis protein CheW [Desulfobulbaceae bacterium]|nr:chemotaxis protein CheW [Desulfobulbaceae bacterium]HIJ79372.1 chemotaxis protein CheW [Deltaproteobacteria bacterium]
MTVDSITETSEYLTFKIDEEYFTVMVHNVREILEYTKITKMPDAPNFMRGIINVRGSVIPVIDLRLKFGMEATIPKASTRIIVMEIEKEGGSLTIGSLADAVKEVIEIAPDQIEPPPDMGTHWKKDYIIGVGQYSDEFIMILDIKKLFSMAELTCLAQS